MHHFYHCEFLISQDSVATVPSELLGFSFWKLIC